MPLERVFFGVGNDRIEYQYDRSKLRLGGRVFVVSDAAGRPVLFSPDPLAGADEYYVQWISPSEWYVPLHRPPKTYPRLVASLSAEGGELLEVGLAESAVRILAARVRPAHLFKTTEVRRNPVAALANVCSRLDLCRLLRQPEVERGLGPHHQPLVTYLLLTCFDRLGQASDWLAFEHWLRSRRHAAEREAAVADITTGLDPTSAARILHESWNARYGVRQSFRRFLREILPDDARRELFCTIDVFKLENPPSLARMPTTDADKETFLYEVRNAYTHRSEWVGGVGDSQIWLPAGWRRDRVTTIFGTEITGGHWRQVWVYGWPWPLDRAVRRGLAAYVRMIVSGEI